MPIQFRMTLWATGLSKTVIYFSEKLMKFLIKLNSYRQKLYTEEKKIAGNRVSTKKNVANRV